MFIWVTWTEWKHWFIRRRVSNYTTFPNTNVNHLKWICRLITAQALTWQPAKCRRQAVTWYFKNTAWQEDTQSFYWERLMVPSCPHYSTSTIHTSCPQMAGMTVRSSSITQLNLSPRDWAVLHTPRLSGVGGNISEVLFLSARDTAFPTTKISPLKYLNWPIHNTNRIIKMKCHSIVDHIIINKTKWTNSYFKYYSEHEFSATKHPKWLSMLGWLTAWLSCSSRFIYTD